ncbi:hypothetical protein TWF970_006953 [Orbilia oligospora]|uniref:Uncharacterized protein n=1 Tax=Orbilia oligospora TaxID=2813651 RepID=A0A7C8R5Q5_ORBOL|nr:hypothetical protein TWF970_006953 [Orbilia oligospora]
MHLQVFSRYCLFIFTFPTFFSFGYGLLPVRCDESTLPPENLGLTSTKFTRNLDNYLEILSTTAVFRNFKNSISEDMKFLHVFLSYIYHPNSLGPRSTLPVAALANLYRLIVGLKLHCFESAFHLAKTLIQVDEAEAYVPVPLPDSDSTADTNPLWMEDEEPNNGWTPEQIFSIRKFRAAYEAFRNDTVTITNKSKYAGLNLNMRQRELSREELKAMVDDPAAVY